MTDDVEKLIGRAYDLIDGDERLGWSSNTRLVHELVGALQSLKARAEAAERRRDEVLEVLRPFAECNDQKHTETQGGFPDALRVGSGWIKGADLTLGDFRRARAVLDAGGEDTTNE